jgi:hypothetical protein
MDDDEKRQRMRKDSARLSRIGIQRCSDRSQRDSMGLLGYQFG